MIRSALDAAGIDGAARQHEGRARLHIHAAIVIVELSRAIVILKPLAAGDEAARRELGVFMGRLGAAVGQGQGAVAGDAEDAARLRFFGIAQDVAVQIYRDIAGDLQPRRNGDVRRQPDHTVGAVRQCGGQRRLRGGLPHGLLGKYHAGQQAQHHTQSEQDTE